MKSITKSNAFATFRAEAIRKQKPARPLPGDVPGDLPGDLPGDPLFLKGPIAHFSDAFRLFPKLCEGMLLSVLPLQTRTGLQVYSAALCGGEPQRSQKSEE